MYEIVKFFIYRPRTVNLVVIFIVVLAVLSGMRIPRLSYPRVDMQNMGVTTLYPGSSPQDVELNVTLPLELELRSIDGIKEFSSRSMENVSRINIAIDPDAEDPEKVKREIRRSLNGVGLPDDAEKPAFFEEKIDNFEIYVAVLTAPDDKKAKLRTHALELKKQLLKLASITQVREIGIPQKEVKILLDHRKISKYYVSFDDIINSIQANRLQTSGGSVESFTTEENIVTLSEFSGINDISNFIVRGNFGDNFTRIRDLGTVVDGFKKDDTIIRYNGKWGVSLWIIKRGGADIIDTVDRIKRVIDDYSRDRLTDGVTISSTFDASIDTRNRLSILYSNAIAGFVLILIVLFLFLHPRIAFWTAMGIPLSVGMTLIVIPFFGVTINSISLCGLVVTIGLIVDDAIIISESIYSSLRNNVPIREACVAGLRAVFLPVLGTIATTIIAFLPLYYIPGAIGGFATEIPTIVIIMLLASLVEATIILPAHLAHVDPKSVGGDAADPPGQRLLTALGKLYMRFLCGAIRYRYLVAVGFVLFLAGGVGLSLVITKFNLFPDDQAYKITLYGETNPNSKLEYTAAVTTKIEDIILSLPEGVVYSYQTQNGRDNNNFLQCNHCFILLLILTPASERSMSAREVKEFIHKEFEKRKITAITRFNSQVDSGGLPSGRPVEIVLTGNDQDRRRELIAEIIAEAEALGLKDVESDYREGKTEILLLPDYGAIAKTYLTMADISRTVRVAFDGVVVANMTDYDTKTPVRLMLDENALHTRALLSRLRVRNAAGQLLPISNFVRTKRTGAAQVILHSDSYRTNTISADVDPAKMTPAEAYALLSKKFRNFEKENPGFSIRLSGEAEESARVFSELLLAVVAAVLAIYFILSIQFNSFSQPFMVIIAIPFGVVGILLAFGVQGFDLSLLSMIGILGFSGITVNGSLIMVDCINRLRNEQSGSVASAWRFRAVIRGGVRRLRPLLLTTLTTVVGLIPTAYGVIGGVDSFISPMVMAMLWGLLVSVVSILVIIPVIYVINDDVLFGVGRVARRFSRRR